MWERDNPKEHILTLFLVQMISNGCENEYKKAQEVEMNS